MARLVTVGTKLAIPGAAPGECPPLCPDCTPLTPTVMMSNIAVQYFFPSAPDFPCEPSVVLNHVQDGSVLFPDACGFAASTPPIVTECQVEGAIEPTTITAGFTDVACANLDNPPEAAWGLSVTFQASSVFGVFTLTLGYRRPFVDCDPSGPYEFFSSSQSPGADWVIMDSGTVGVTL